MLFYYASLWTILLSEIKLFLLLLLLLLLLLHFRHSMILMVCAKISGEFLAMLTGVALSGLAGLPQWPQNQVKSNDTGCLVTLRRLASYR